ncbi:hypothetical protein [Paratractidigestivibacter sp.]|uniref:hypothetical protein n=1 Tax=Paratractidigestivibacter sp. TaxID=2847316 RepID=UPI002ACB12C4|nr:hypothetical protein [Paratractidigestivibacter sp.]
MAAYPHAVKKGDFTGFRDIYVGKSYSMGASAFADATGAGSPEVYADVKFKQHVYVPLYPCERETWTSSRSRSSTPWTPTSRATVRPQQRLAEQVVAGELDDADVEIQDDFLCCHGSASVGRRCIALHKFCASRGTRIGAVCVTIFRTCVRN